MSFLGRHPGLVALAVVVVAGASAAGVLRSKRASDMDRARARAADDLGAFQRCLLGPPLGPGETLGGRVRGIELAVALAGLERESQQEALDGGAAGDAGASGEEGLRTPDPGAWPARCATIAEHLARHLDAFGDARLDALREALPSRARLDLPYALMADEAAELSAAVEKAALPPPAHPAENEPAPAALVPPIDSTGLVPLGKGRIRFENGRKSAFEVMSTSAVHMIVRSVPPRVCSFALDGPAGPYGVARCGGLPKGSDGVAPEPVSFVHLEEGAPLALMVRKPTPKAAYSAYGGMLVLSPGKARAVPVNESHHAFEAFLGADGTYVIPAYAPLVRVGNVSAFSSDDVTAPSGGDRTVSAMHSAIDDAVAAYGLVLFNHRAPLYRGEPGTFWGRRIFPTLAGDATELGINTASTLGGCRVDGHTAVLFHELTWKLRKARLVLADGDGPPRALEPEAVNAPNLWCGKGEVAVTSIDTRPRDAAPGTMVVVESRCSGTSCTTKRSAPFPVPEGVELEAATLDGGVLVVWLTRPDHVTSSAKGMAFYKFGPLEGLAAAPARPMLEGARRGGIDAVHLHLVPRPKGAVVALETGGKTPETYAIRIDGSGAPAAVRVEETTW